MRFAFIVLVGVSELGVWPIEADIPVLRLRSTSCLTVAAWLAVLGVRNALALPATRSVSIEIEGWPVELDGLRIVQVSAIRIGHCWVRVMPGG
jgi:hypothetical protein